MKRLIERNLSCHRLLPYVRLLDHHDRLAALWLASQREEFTLNDLLATFQLEANADSTDAQSLRRHLNILVEGGFLHVREEMQNHRVYSFNRDLFERFLKAANILFRQKT